MTKDELDVRIASFSFDRDSEEYYSNSEECSRSDEAGASFDVRPSQPIRVQMDQLHVSHV